MILLSFAGLLLKIQLNKLNMKLSALFILIAFTLSVSAQDKPAYKVFTGTGKKSDYNDIIKEAAKADVVFFGELHDNPVAHWLELEITKDIFSAKGKDLILAAEMFETDNQLLIDEYFSDIIKESSFEKEVRLWKNYQTDYKPLVSFAKQNGLKFIASNIPRRYASVVAGGGFEALQQLSPEALKYIAPLPVEYDPELPCYKDMLSMEGGIGGGMEKKVNENLPKAQAIKDATMARSIANYRHDGQTVIHYNGSYHSDRHMGILWYLARYQPGVRVMTITCVLQDDIEKMSDESKDQADFVIVIPTSMTRTY
jgi:uncharacterized iron-regulated protein